MCGLFGWTLDKNKVDFNKLSIAAAVLSVENDRRGGDSWGIYNPKTKFLFKKLGEISNCISAKSLAKNYTLLGHTRKATKGIINQKNAHPFKFEKIIGAHNGIVFNHDLLNYKYDRKCEVDSMHIFLHLQNNLPVDEIDAYGAVEYINKDDPDSIYLAKFNFGDLALAEIKDRGGYIWSSNEESLEYALMLSHINATMVCLEDEHLYVIKNNELFDLGEKMEFGYYSVNQYANQYSSIQTPYQMNNYEGKFNNKTDKKNRRERRKTKIIYEEEDRFFDDDDYYAARFDELEHKFRNTGPLSDKEAWDYIYSSDSANESGDDLTDEELRELDESGME